DASGATSAGAESAARPHQPWLSLPVAGAADLAIGAERDPLHAARARDVADTRIHVHVGAGAVVCRAFGGVRRVFGCDRRPLEQTAVADLHERGAVSAGRGVSVLAGSRVAV